ncbi:unnamed protein product [Ixodes hexagonus]
MSLSKPSAKRKVEDEKRCFQERWELPYFFTESRGKVLCLICNQTVAVPKDYNVRRHFMSCHHEKYGAFTGKIREHTVPQLKAALGKQQDLFKKVAKASDETVRASFVISELIAKSSKPFTEGLFEVADATCPSMKKAFEKISLSPNTVAERINEISENIEKGLINRCHEFEAFSIAVDESTDITDNAQCAIFVRGIDKNLNVTEELLDLIPMKGTTTGRIFFLFSKEWLNTLDCRGRSWFAWPPTVRHLWLDARAGSSADCGRNSRHWASPINLQRFTAFFTKKRCAASLCK